MLLEIVITTLLAVTTLVVSKIYISPLETPQSPSLSEKTKALDEWLKELANSGKFNGVVLIARNNKILFANGYSSASIDPMYRVSTDDIFNLASVSKSYTALGVLLLLERGEINLDDSISRYLDGFEHFSANTIRHLLHHTSNLPEYLHVMSDFGSEKYINNEKIISVLRESTPLRIDPGTRFEYCNSGYVLLATIVERVSSLSFENYMNKIFTKARLENTLVFDAVKVSNVKRALGFKKKFFLWGKVEPHDLSPLDGIVGDGGIYSNARDIFKFHKALNEGHILSKNILKDFVSPQGLPNGSNYGFGWFKNEDGSIEHPGGWQGFASFVYSIPERGDLIVILDNSQNILRVTTRGTKYNSIGKNLISFLKSF